MLVDYHMHLIHDYHEEKCPYTLDRVAEYLRAAERNGIEEIGVTDHCDRFREFLPMMQHLFTGDGVYEAVAGWLSKRFYEPLDEYVEVLFRAQQRGWPVKIALEVDFIPGAEDAMREVLAPYPWDYLIGSVHFIGKWGIDISPDSGWPEKDVDEVYEAYFGLLTQAAKSGLFDTLAHPDLVKKFGHRPKQDPEKWYVQVVEAASAAGVALEVSTAGLRRGESELYPAQPFLERIGEKGVPITLASDAHYPEHIGADFETSLRRCEEAGITSFTRFTRRVKEAVPF